MRSHMGNGSGLSRGSGGCDSGGSPHVTSGAATDEPAADLLGDIKLATSEGSRPGDCVPGAAILWSLRLEQRQHPLGAVRRPRRDDPPVAFAQRLRRAHRNILAAHQTGGPRHLHGQLSCADREQAFLLPPDVRDWLPEARFAWFVLDAVAQMDLGAFYAAYRQDGHGRAAFEPSMVVALLLYAYARGIRSSRAIERACEEDVAFRVLAAHQVPDHTTSRGFASVIRMRSPVSSARFSRCVRMPVWSTRGWSPSTAPRSTPTRPSARRATTSSSRARCSPTPMPLTPRRTSASAIAGRPAARAARHARGSRALVRRC